MATYDFTDGSISGQDVPPEVTPDETKAWVQRNVIDAANQNLASGDVAQAMNIEAGCTVLTAWARVITADSGGGTISLGYGGAASKWGSGGAVSAADADVLGSFDPAYFASDDTIDITVSTAALTTAKLEVCALVVKQISSF